MPTTDTKNVSSIIEGARAVLIARPGGTPDATAYQMFYQAISSLDRSPSGKAVSHLVEAAIEIGKRLYLHECGSQDSAGIRLRLYGVLKDIEHAAIVRSGPC